jgi:hypothetical protein
MIYDFKQKLNAFDSSQNRGYQIPEIDWKLNAALKVLINNISSPRTNVQIGFEFNQRNIDDIRPIIARASIQVNDNFARLPRDYYREISTFAIVNKGSCTKKIRVYKVQFDDLWETDPFVQSSFEWEELNALQVNDGMELKPTDFTVSEIHMDYLRDHPYIHNAQGYGGSYKLPSGVTLSGKQDCLFDDDLCSEIVDLAVFMTVNDSIYNPQTKQTNLSLRN